MDHESTNERLSRISTVWTVVRQAHGAQAGEALGFLVERYGKAVRRYLLAAVRDPHVADDLAQEFALSVLRGGLRGADPERGRFRNYVKTALFNLVSGYRRKQRGCVAGCAVPGLPPTPAADEEADRLFLESWRDQLLERAWRGLAGASPKGYAVLRLRAEQPRMASHRMAERLTAELGEPISADAVRKTLERARALFARLLVEEVACSVEPPTAERVEEELAELRLLEFCCGAGSHGRNAG
jgi:RNA polymerase sigma-70 factor (ECF subfamily)